MDSLQLLNAQTEIMKPISCNYTYTYQQLTMSQKITYLKISSIGSCLYGDDDIIKCENRFYISISIVSSIYESNKRSLNHLPTNQTDNC